MAATDNEVRTKQIYCTHIVETTHFVPSFLGLWEQTVVEKHEVEIGCNQAVSIQIWDQVIVYSAKDGLLIEENYIGKMLVPQGDFIKKLMKGVRITKSKKDTYEVLLPNGDTVKVWLELDRFSLTIEISSLPSNYKQVQGFCAITRDMNAQEAMKTYLIEEKDSNFKGTKELATEQSSTQNVCLCESGKVNCMETLSFLGCNEAGNEV
ncbi:uncharacterized protein LOC131944160 [Physella acuta]|uniref:uncharacterized protein LOC131944160 n=1 Tax=Physella acuta TaxID=109671 RepID=UPI0027DDC0CD|nr:uncharacterized protein LOC131944160 [Physella acuta]